MRRHNKKGGELLPCVDLYKKRNQGWLFSNTSHEMSITKPLSSLLTVKEKEVVNDFIKNGKKQLITAVVYGSCFCGTVALHGVRLPRDFIDQASSHTAADHHRLHCHVVSDCVGVRYFVSTSAITIICGFYTTRRGHKMQILIPRTKKTLILG